MPFSCFSLCSSGSQRTHPSPFPHLLCPLTFFLLLVTLLPTRFCFGFAPLSFSVTGKKKKKCWENVTSLSEAAVHSQLIHHASTPSTRPAYAKRERERERVNVILPFKEFNFVQRDALPSPGLLRSVQVGLSHLAVVPAFRVSREFHTGARGRRGLKEEEERERDLFCLGVETRFFSFSFSCSSSPSVRTETSPSKCCSRASPVNSTQLNSTRLDSTRQLASMRLIHVGLAGSNNGSAPLSGSFKFSRSCCAPPLVYGLLGVPSFFLFFLLCCFSKPSAIISSSPVPSLPDVQALLLLLPPPPVTLPPASLRVREASVSTTTPTPRLFLCFCFLFFFFSFLSST